MSDSLITFGDFIQFMTAEFDPSEVKHREGGGSDGIYYIDWQSFVKRLNTMAIKNQIRYSFNFNTKSDGEGYQCDATLYVTTSDGEQTFGGSGYAEPRGRSFDRDDAIKACQSEAIKKTFYNMGSSAELWNDEYRETVVKGYNEFKILGKALVDQYKDDTETDVTPTAAVLAEHYGVDEEDLRKPETLVNLVHSQYVPERYYTLREKCLL